MFLLGVSGALRAASFNTALVRAAAEAFAPDRFEMADLRLPLYDGDLEAQGIPETVQRLVAQMREADAVAVSSPEYNRGLSGVLKNALDWISRVRPQPLAGKPVAIMSAAAGRSGGERGQATLRHCLQPFEPRLVQMPEVLVAAPDRAFADGALADPKGRDAVAALMKTLRVETARNG